MATKEVMGLLEKLGITSLPEPEKLKGKSVREIVNLLRKPERSVTIALVEGKVPEVRFKGVWVASEVRLAERTLVRMFKEHQASLAKLLELLGGEEA